jgi:hypothetical protein
VRRQQQIDLTKASTNRVLAIVEQCRGGGGSAETETEQPKKLSIDESPGSNARAHRPKKRVLFVHKFFGLRVQFDDDRRLRVSHFGVANWDVIGGIFSRAVCSNAWLPSNKKRVQMRPTSETD